MNRLFIVTGVALIALFASDLSAQGGRTYRKNKNSYKKAADKANKDYQKHTRKAAKNAEKEEREAEREEAQEERAARRKGEDDDGISIVGGSESDDVPEPGAEVERAVKDKVIDDIMDQLELEDEDKREKFKKTVRDAWEDTEKQDKRYAKDYARNLDDPEDLAHEKEEHQEKLKKIWDEADEDLVKDEVLDEDQLKKWQEASKELRTRTATDRYYESLKEKPNADEEGEVKEQKGED